MSHHTSNNLSTNKGIALSKRSRLKLSDTEHTQLREFLLNDPAGYKTISLNTSLAYKTIKDAATTGAGQVKTVVSLRDFLKKLAEQAA